MSFRFHRSFRIAAFTLLIAAAPLLYGATDRFWQAILLLIFGIIFWGSPAPRLHPSRLQWMLAITFLLLLIGKEFLAGIFFGVPEWRTLLRENYNIPLSIFGNPAPVVAIDLILTLLLAGIWFIWVRSLSGSAVDPIKLPMLLLFAAALLAVVSVVMQQFDTKFIYGIRLIRGWQGFGPLPNRNHTATILAMGMIMGIGCFWYFFENRRWRYFTLSLFLTVLVTFALLKSQSRGGLLAAIAGLGVMLALYAWRTRSKAMIGASAGIILLFIAGVFFSRTDILSRVLKPEPTDRLSNVTRIEIWRDTFSMWKDTPILGQGLGTFAEAFPFYKTVSLENDNVLHPESSWLLWLTELGVLPLLVALIFGGTLLDTARRNIWHSHRSMIPRIAGLSAWIVLLIHAVYDVPTGRWAVGAFGLAALAIASPLPRDQRPHRGQRWIGIGVIGIAVFWLFSFFTGKPAASMGARERILTIWTDPSRLSVEEIDDVLKAFPLDIELHQIAAYYKYAEPELQKEAWHHFSILNRLLPDSWKLPQQQAMLAAPHDSGMAFSYWALAVERSGERAVEMLSTALEQTKSLPGSTVFWQSFIRNHPQLEPAYAAHLPKEQQTSVARKWLQSDQDKFDAPLRTRKALYELIRDPELEDDFFHWRKKHATLESTDFLYWSKALQRMGYHKEAWELIRKYYPQQPAHSQAEDRSPTKTERQYRLHPTDWVNTQKLIQHLESENQIEERYKILIQIAADPQTPEWFLIRAAYAMAEKEEYAEALSILYRLAEKRTP